MLRHCSKQLVNILNICNVSFQQFCLVIANGELELDADILGSFLAFVGILYNVLMLNLADTTPRLIRVFCSCILLCLTA